jgi:hypothetical protein
MKREALFSKDKKLRYTLGRFWNDSNDNSSYSLVYSFQVEN